MQCKRCPAELAANKLIPLCASCEEMLVHAADKFHISLEAAIDRVWMYGPDRKGCTKLILG